MVGAVALGDEPRQLELVEGLLLEADREGADPIAALGSGERRQSRRVDPAGEPHADRDIGDQACPDRVPQPAAELRRERLLRLRPHLFRGDGGRAGVAAQLHLAVLGDERVAGGQLARLIEDRQRGGYRVEGEEGLKRGGVDLPGEAGLADQRLELGGKGELATGDAVVEGLDAEPVAREDQAAVASVPDRDREHPAQRVHEAGAPVLIEVDEDLGAAVGGGCVSPPAELLPELAVVVDLAVLDHLDAAVLVADRLIASREVDDREAAHRQAARPVDQAAVRVGTAVDQRLVHRRQRRGIRGRGPVEADETAYPAHARKSRERLGSLARGREHPAYRFFFGLVFFFRQAFASRDTSAVRLPRAMFASTRCNPQVGSGTGFRVGAPPTGLICSTWALLAASQPPL